MAQVSMHHIAEKAGVSTMTVSLALRNHPSIPQATTQRIKEIAESLGYKRNPLISALMANRGKHKTSKTSGLTLAFITTFSPEDAWRQFPSLVAYFNGASKRAKELGYNLEPFWAANPELSIKRMNTMLWTRNIQGLLFSPGPSMQVQIQIDCTPYACIGLEMCYTQSNLNRVIPDYRFAMTECLRQLKARGYKKIGIAIRSSVDARSDYLWSSTYQAFHKYYGFQKSIPPLFFDNYNLVCPENLEALNQWYTRYKPEAIISVSPDIIELLKSLKLKVPEDIGLASVELKPSHSYVSGVFHRKEDVGAAAAEQLISKINHNIRGLPKFNDKLFIEGVWNEGTTLLDFRS